LNSSSVRSLVQHSAEAGAPVAGSAGGERLRALRGQLRHGQDVGRRVQVALRVAAHQLPVLREGDVALDDAGALARGRHVRLAGVLRELQPGSAVSDGEVAPEKRPLGAGRELALEPPLVHVVDQVERTRPQLDILDAAGRLGGRLARVLDLDVARCIEAGIRASSDGGGGHAQNSDSDDDDRSNSAHWCPPHVVGERYVRAVTARYGSRDFDALARSDDRSAGATAHGARDAHMLGPSHSG